MKQKTINQNKLQTIFCIIALTLGVLVSAVLFSMPPVHAEESTSYSHTYTLVTETRTSDSSNYTSREDIYSTDLQFVLVGSNIFTEEKKIYNLHAYIKNDRFPDGTISIINDSLFSGLFDWDVTHYKNGEATNTFHNNKNQLWFSYTESTETYNTGVTVARTIDTNVPMFDTYDHALAYCRNGDEDGWLNKPETPNTVDESYTFTGFSINGKTARWTGTTERSYLKDQEVEEYTTITYAWATTTEPDNIGEFQTYNGEFPTSDKQLKLPWSDMENNKNDNEFIRQVNLIPCYRVPGAFYHGSGVKVFYKSDGTIERTEFIKKQTDLNTGNMVYDSSIGYLQNVIYTEEKTHDGKGRQATFKWSTSKSMSSDAQVEIVAKNFYIEWFNKTTEENFVYKEYGEDCIYSVGSYSFNANTPAWTWLNEKDIDPFSVKTQSYGTKEYYLRIITYNDNDNMYHYGGWVRVNVKTKDSTNMPTTDVETGGFDDDSGLWDKDLDSDDSYHYSTDDKGNLTGDIDIDSWEDLNINSFTWMYRNLQSMAQTLGQLPSMVSAIFGFLPSQVITAIGVLLIAVVLMRFLGR